MWLLLLNLSITLTIAVGRFNRDVGHPCPGPPDKGPCNRVLYKWAFDHDKNTCVAFEWGGCAGNAKNRFNTEIQCIKTCMSLKYQSFNSANLTVPREKRGPQLTFQETGNQNTFMFAQSNTFIQIDGDIIQTFQLRLCRQISFRFRTRLPHGLLVYHNVKVPAGVSLQPYALYIIVEQGQLKVVHVYGKHSTALTVGRGLNRDEWHSVTVRIDVHGGRLMATVDDEKEEKALEGLDKENNYGVSANVTSVILIGGLSSEERLHGVKYIIESFVGCIKDVILSSGKSASDLLPITPLIATKHENVQEGCIDKCQTSENLCFRGSRCINHYNSLTCDCFGTFYEGEFCDIYTATLLTLRGSSYVSYRVYDWKDRVHSSINRFSMLFKTRFDDSALFYAAGGDHGIDHYLAASIYNSSVYIEINFDNNSVNRTLGQTGNFKLDQWNNLTIFHNQDKILLILNDEIVELDFNGSRMLYIDPEIYIGGGPELQKKRGLSSRNNFAGSLKYIFFNDISILYELNKNNPKVHYIGILRPEFHEADVTEIPITFPFASSHIWWLNKYIDNLSITFNFKSSSNLSVLASSESKKLYWELRVVNDEVRFELMDMVKNVTHLISVKKTPKIWHFLNLTYFAGDVILNVDNREKQEKIEDLKFAVGDKIKAGSGSRSNSGLVGCMRDITVNGESLEPRSVLQSERVVGEVTLDDCKFVDPCLRPNTCEHGGKCSVKEDKLICDCTDSGYTGKNCHFTKYRKTCEELALLGYTKPDVYLIDIDGNGRFPPAHVRCEFQSIEDSTKTIVEHNLPSQIDVRSPSEKDFSFTIKYREFTADMLQELVSHSLNCSQYIKYDCFKAPLGLHSATWFISSANETVDFIGDVKRGTCPCSVGKKCENPSQWCNCDDAADEKWTADDGYYTTANSLGITKMIFLQNMNLPEEALGRITLGPLECVETNTQRYVVTFTTSQSYIEVPGWRKGDLAFSFRTTGKQAILLYQPPIRPYYPSFTIALTSDNHLTFNFTLNTGVSKELVIKSGRKLNGGEWHKLWIDYNKYHVRLMINEEQKMDDLKPDEEFGPFEGSMFIGGAPNELLDPKATVHQGLIGCFRGLVVNEEILDIYSYMSVHLSEIIKDCKPSCVPSPCQNGAQCKELWSTFECICPNPWAYKGEYCETNINVNALTFTKPQSFLHRNYLSTDEESDKNALKKIFQEQILINLRTYDEQALIFYANDHLNNFVHLYICNGTQVVFLFNYGNEIFDVAVDQPQLNSSQSVQIAIERETNKTTMYVNDKNNSIPIGVLLLETYLNKPWINPEKEVLAPQRPPAPPTEYFQLNLGGYDPETLLKVAEDPPFLPGYVGCVRGFQIGETLIDLPPKVKDVDEGVKANCNMKCDALPCKHGGVCIENFRNQDYTCDCEHTSYYGESCSDEKGADFSGESILWREYILNGSVDHVKIQLAFSSIDVRQKKTVLLLLQTENNRSYYLLVGLSLEGHLIIQEDREGAVFSATVNTRSFINGARHSVYYRRDHNDSELLVDREVIEMIQIPAESFTNVPELGANEVQIGGHNTNDPRFALYKGYSGCLSNILIEVNEHIMKPLEEYMLFTKTGAEKVNVSNPQGVRSAQCSSHFDDLHEKTLGTPNLNISQGKDKTWVEDAPQRILYMTNYLTTTEQEEGVDKFVVIALSVFFVLIIVCCVYELYRTDKQYRQRKEQETDANILWSKEQAAKMQETPFIQVPPETPSKPSAQNGKIPNQNLNGKSSAKEDLVVPTTEIVPALEEVPAKALKIVDNKREKRISFRDSASELAWDTPDENSELLTTMHEEDEENERSDEELGPKSVPLTPPVRARIRSPPPHSNPLATQLPYMIDEVASLDSTGTSSPISSNETNKDDISLKEYCAPEYEYIKDDIKDEQVPQDKTDKDNNHLNEKSQLERLCKFGGIQKPVFLNEHQRKFGNPISYLGGPRLAPRNRWSVESVLSLD